MRHVFTDLEITSMKSAAEKNLWRSLGCGMQIVSVFDADLTRPIPHKKKMLYEHILKMGSHLKCGGFQRRLAPI